MMAPQLPLLAIEISSRQSEDCSAHPRRDVYIWSVQLLFRPIWKHLNLHVLICEVCPGCGGTGRGQAAATAPPAPIAGTPGLSPPTRAGAAPCPPKGKRYSSHLCSCAAVVFHLKMPPSTFPTYKFECQEDTQSCFLKVGTQKGVDTLLLLLGWEASDKRMQYSKY